MDEPTVTFSSDGAVAVIMLNRGHVANAQNAELLLALDDAFTRFADDDGLAVAVLGGVGKHFSSGHDLREVPQDHRRSLRRRGMGWDQSRRSGVEMIYGFEQEQFLGLCRRWREIPKPTIAMVQGACVAGGLMLAWSCDLIVAAQDAYFSDPVVALGVPGHELFRHPWEMGARHAKEFLFLGEQVSAARALELGMVNRVVTKDLRGHALELARQIARRPPFALALAKQAVHQAEDAMGVRSAENLGFVLHQLAHARNLQACDSPIIDPGAD